MTRETVTSKRWECFECGWTYVSPIPVSEAHHRCKKTLPPKAKRRGMVPK